MRRLAFTWSAALLLGAEALHGQCATPMYLSGGFADLIHLDGIFISEAQLSQAASYWSACAGYGHGFPSFTTQPVSTQVDVHVTYHPGQSNTSCGTAQHITPNHVEIELWDEGRTTAGGPYTCNVVDTLAHELGHVLDLDNSSCSGFMMGPAPLSNVNGRLVAGTRSVNSNECFVVNDRWTTSEDRQRAGGGNGGPPPCI